MLDGLIIHTAIIADYSSGCEMMASGFARQFWRLREVHGHSLDAEQASKMTAKPPPGLAQARSAA
jgi:hypothetical protein